MIKEKASDPALESRPLLSHPPCGWIWLNVTYCLGEIDGNQTPSLALRKVLTWVPHTDWLCVRVHMCYTFVHIDSAAVAWP